MIIVYFGKSDLHIVSAIKIFVSGDLELVSGHSKGCGFKASWIHA